MTKNYKVLELGIWFMKESLNASTLKPSSSKIKFTSSMTHFSQWTNSNVSFQTCSNRNNSSVLRRTQRTASLNLLSASCTQRLIHELNSAKMTMTHAQLIVRPANLSLASKQPLQQKESKISIGSSSLTKLRIWSQITMKRMNRMWIYVWIFKSNFESKLMVLENISFRNLCYL